MKTIYKFTRKKDFQKGYTREQIKNLEEYYKTSKPVDYFVNQIRYRDLITMSFKDKSEYGKIFDIVKNKLSVYFFSFKVEKKKNQYTVKLSFSDFIRFLLINEIHTTFGVSNDNLRQILLGLRYTVIKRPNKMPEGDLITYLTDTELFSVFYRKEHSQKELKERIRELEKEIKEKGFAVLFECFEEEKFEKVLYYILHYKQPMHLLMHFEGNNMYRLDYTTDSLMSQQFRKGICMDLLYFIRPHSKSDKNSLGDIIHGQLVSHMHDSQKKIKDKRDYEIKLVKERNSISIEDIKKDETEYKLISEKIQKTELEADIGIYDIDKSPDIASDDLGNVFKDMEEFVSKAGNSELTVSFKDQKPMYMKGKFKTMDFDKYGELKEYTSDYGYIAQKNHKGSKSVIVGEKEFKYKKSK